MPINSLSGDNNSILTLCYCRAKRPIMNNEFRPVDHQQQQDRGEIMNIPNPMALHLEMYEHNHAEMEEQNGDEEQNAW